MSDIHEKMEEPRMGCPNCCRAETEVLVSTDGPVIRFSIRWCPYCGAIAQYTSSSLGGLTSIKYPEMTSKHRIKEKKDE